MSKREYRVLEQVYRDRFEEMAGIIEESERRKGEVVSELREGRREETGYEVYNAGYFDYYKWITWETEHKNLEEIIENPCGTHFCIGGWGTVKQLTAEGLGKCGIEKIGTRLRLIESADESGLEDSFLLDGSRAEEAAARWYGLEEEEAALLFYGHWHPDTLEAPAEDVIRKLREIAKTGEVRLRRYAGGPMFIEDADTTTTTTDDA